MAYTEVKQPIVSSENPAQQNDFNQNSISTLGTNQTESLVESDFSNRVEDNQSVQFDLIPVEIPQMEPIQKEEMPVPVMDMRPPRAPNSIRERPLDPAYIEDYLQRNKHKVSRILVRISPL